MLYKALWWREWRAARWLLWLLPAAHFLVLGMQRLNLWYMQDEGWIRHRLLQMDTSVQAYMDGSLESGARMIVIMGMIVLALLQIGSERRNGSQELLFSLPFSRGTVFATKLAFGLALIAATFTLNTLVDMLIMANSPAAQYFSFTYHLAQWGYSMLCAAAIYALALFIGTICGSVASQSVLSFLMWVLPFGLLTLIEFFLQIHDLFPALYAGNHTYRTIQDALILGNYVFVDHYFFSFFHAAMMAFLLFASALGGMIAYERNQVEHNGKLMVFAVWEKVLKIGFIFCFTLIGGMFLYAMLGSERLAAFYAGALIALALSTVIIQRLTRMRLKI